MLHCASTANVDSPLAFVVAPVAGSIATSAPCNDGFPVMKKFFEKTGVDVDQVALAEAREHRQHPLGLVGLGVEVDLAALVLQDRHRERYFAVGVDHAADDVRGDARD
jgi:hypothetical protein